MSDEDITSLVFQREQARLVKDWNLADGLRERLTQLGVTIFDKTNSWKSADGTTGRIPTWSEIESGVSPETMHFSAESKVMAECVNSGNPEAHIKHLVATREQARAAKDFAQSDRIRDDLKAMGVDLFDKEKVWRAKNGMSGIIVGYRGAAGPTDVEVSTLVLQRERARQSGDYGAADMIRQELKQFGIEIHDKEKVWRSADGRSGGVPNWDTMAGGARGQNFAPAANGVDLQQQVVQAALQAAQNPQTAARTLQLLQQVSGGAQQQQAMAMRSGGMIMPMANSGGGMVMANSGGGMAIGSSPTSPEANDALHFISSCQASGRSATDSEIEWLVTVREKLRQNKDYNSGDEIRKAMRGQLGVELKEKEKCWIANDGRQGSIPFWGTLG